MSSLPYLHINRPTTVIESSAIKIVYIFMPVLVVWFLLSMAIPYRQETLFLDAEQMTILSYSNGLVLGRWGVVNIKPFWHLEMCRVISEISQYPTIDISEPSWPNGLVRINPYFDHTFLVWCEWDLRYMSWVARDILRSIYDKTTQLQNTVYLAPVKRSQIKGSVVCCNH